MHRSPLGWFPLLSLLASSCTGDPDAAATPPVRPAAPQLRIELQVARPVLFVGDKLECSAVLVNDGSEPVVVVLPGDGSESGWRTPAVRWTPPWGDGRDCGNINSLRPEDVVALGAGQRVPLTWLDPPRFRAAGSHAVRVTLENVPDLTWRGLAHHDADTMARVRRTVPFTAVSNVVEVRVEERR